MGAMRTIEGFTAVVTGASAGIGEATAHTLASAGVDLVLGARREERLESIAATLRDDHGVAVTPVRTDVTEREDVDRLVETAVAEHGSLDVLVNNAGMAHAGDVESMADEEYRRMMAVNTDGMFYATRAALPHLRETRGVVVFVGSFAGQYPRAANPVYAATKWWTRGFAHSLQGQVGEDGVAVSVINPSEVRTEFGSQRGAPATERFEEGEVTDPTAIAEAIRFAVQQDRVDTVSELNLYRRDKFTGF
ncbi:SDR family oxidoreductase [Halorubrum sp. JWXQ-INN 858]|uniref:SDR family oxidoreductase n=1 Tax=Halorubrum sp. JWXQ-INN 858 TaxID=2690782 RepID=UPI003744362F